jgi:hypothetical protein
MNINEFSYENAPYTDKELEVLTTDMQHRTVMTKPLLDPSTLWFTDCTHPAQNAYCNRNSIIKWRLRCN